jgi:hypothetical protein
MEDTTYKEEQEKPTKYRVITSDDLFVLVKILREYRQLLPRADETVMERYKANICEDLLNKLLAKGIDWTIGHYSDKKFALILRQKAQQELNGDEDAIRN